MKMLTLLLATTLVAQATQSPESAPGSARVSVAWARLRSRPDLRSRVLTTLRRETLLSVVGKEGAWLEVKVVDSGLGGFIFGTLVEVVAVEAPTVAAVPSPSPSPIETGTIAGRVSMLVKGGGRADDLSDAVVYVEGAPAASLPTTVRMNMRGKEFIPHVLVVGAGSRVDFPNSDPILHNVFSPSTPNGFDLGLYMRPEGGAWVFRRAGLVRVYCNIHPQMSAVVVVRDNPYFTKPSANGSFTIPAVPAGRYTLRAWHEQAEREGATTVVVPSGGTVSAALALDASAYQEIPHKRKDGKDYSPEASRQ